jgi:integrase/recombinase XerD
MNGTSGFPALLEAFFTDRLMRQRQVSPHTILSYRDTFRLLLHYAQERLHKAPSDLTMPELDTPLIGAFLDHLEQERENSARSRNVRLAAIHSFFRYVALHEPQYSALAQRVLGMPNKRYTRRPIEFLTRVEVEALLAAPVLDNWTGRRDHAMLLLAVQTGLRAAELIGLRCQDIVLGPSAHVRCLGKGRKVRCTPLRKDTVTVLRSWLKERHGAPDDPAFPNARGTELSHDGLQYMLAKHLATARRHCPSLARKHITPHCLRHTLAMELLQHGVGRSVLALWLGHESLETTAMYVHADLKLKELALAKTVSVGVRPGRYQPEDRVLVFLKSL